MKKQLFTIRKIVAFLFLLIATTTFAQEAKPGQPIGGIVVKGGKNPGGNMLIITGGGITIPNNSFKNNNNSGNFTNFNANVFIPIFQYGGATGGVINYGFNAGFEYFSGNKDYDLEMHQPYSIIGQTSSPTTTAKGSGSPRQAGFKTEAGIQANYNIGRFTISPIVNAAYISINQKAFEITQSISVNGQTRDFILYSQSETKTKGLGITPKIRLSYHFGKDKTWGIYSEAGYLFGPAVKTDAVIFRPNGNPNAQGNYNIDQMLSGTYKTTETKYNFGAFAVNVGVNITIGNRTQGQGVSPNQEPQNMIYGGNAPLKICIRFYGIDGNELNSFSETGFINLYQVFSLSLLPCGGTDPAAISLPPINTDISGQTIKSKLFVKSDKSLEGKSIKINKDIDISKDIAGKYGVETAIVKAGNYTFNSKNEIELPIVFGAKTIKQFGIKSADLNYDEDYRVEDAKILEFLHTNELIIKKGNYAADYSQNPFGTITLSLAFPINAKGIKEKGIKRMSGSGYHCDRDCKEEKDVCWTCKGSKPKALFYYFTLEPVIEKGMITQLKIMNTKIMLGDKSITASEYKKLKGKTFGETISGGLQAAGK